MNNQEVTMTQTAPQSGFEAHDKAVRAAALAISLVTRIPAPLRSLADQVVRSASSVPANLAEGSGRSGRDRTYHYRIAYASAKEVDSHLRILCLSRAIPLDQAGIALELFDGVRAMTWRLIHPK
jgi:four helix bundle protein